MSYDILIIGGAVMGASTAFWLTRMQPGLKVAIVERDPSYTYASTALSAASIRSQFSNPANVELARFGLEFIRDFAAQTGPAGGVPDLGFRENGYLFLAETEESAALMEDLAGMQRGLGAGTMVLSRAELAGRFPWMNFDDIVAGSFGPRDEGWFDNMGLMAGMLNAARAAGADFIADEVVGLDTEGSRLLAARLASGRRIEGGGFVNASGTRAAKVLRWLGADLPVEPRKRTVFIVDAPEARHPEAPMIIEASYYARPEHNQWLTATVPANDGPCADDDFEPDHGLFEETIWPALWRRAEGFAAAKVMRFWTGHYAYNTLDQNAILGLHPGFANLWLANGFSGHGLQQAPGVGRGIAEQILTGSWRTLDLTPLGVGRILRGEPFLEKAIV